jgi:hypothetical protein
MRRSNIIAFLFTVASFGILVPWWKGLEFLDAVMILVSCCISLVFVAPMAADGFTGRNIRSEVVMPVTYAFVLAFLILANGLATVNIAHWFGHVLLPSVSIMIGGLVLNLVAGYFLALATVAIIRRGASPEKAKKVLRTAFFGLLLIAVFVFRFSPEWIGEQLTDEGLRRIIWSLVVLLTILDVLLWRIVQRWKGAAQERVVQNGL